MVHVCIPAAEFSNHLDYSTVVQLGSECDLFPRIRYSQIAFFVSLPAYQLLGVVVLVSQQHILFFPTFCPRVSPPFSALLARDSVAPAFNAPILTTAHQMEIPESRNVVFYLIMTFINRYFQCKVCSTQGCGCLNINGENEKKITSHQRKEIPKLARRFLHISLHVYLLDGTLPDTHFRIAVTLKNQKFEKLFSRIEAYITGGCPYRIPLNNKPCVQIGKVQNHPTLLRRLTQN